MFGIVNSKSLCLVVLVIRRVKWWFKVEKCFGINMTRYVIFIE